MNAHIMPEFVVCSEKPQVAEYDGRYFIMFRRNMDLTVLYADESKDICHVLAGRYRQVAEKHTELEWKLPTNPHSRVIEYYGVPHQYSPIRFAIMKLLILAKGEPVPYSKVAEAGWGYSPDRTVIEKQIYPLNLFLKNTGVPTFSTKNAITF